MCKNTIFSAVESQPNGGYVYDNSLLHCNLPSHGGQLLFIDLRLSLDVEKEEKKLLREQLLSLENDHKDKIKSLQDELDKVRHIIPIFQYIPLQTVKVFFSKNGGVAVVYF